MGESSCCSAPVYEESDICSACKEHCDEIEVHCYACDWEGKEEEVSVDGEYTQEDGFVGTISCPKCGEESLEDV